ncbi:10916_t:CDS:2 [Ambispora leptoticha]|uniref:10916_t:CDS:1 n=1 Tax=Ambispora leptoticha TaxID=144679 RepID=A0A9N9H5R7_9GLOM|nr:10916_t:CDS:2 [Ambispora leptoticha]
MNNNDDGNEDTLAIDKFLRQTSNIENNSKDHFLFETVEFDFNKLRLNDNNKNEHDDDLLLKRSRRESAAIFNTLIDEIPDALDFLNDTLDINDAVDNEEYENEIRCDDIESLDVVMPPLSTEIRDSAMMNNVQKKYGINSNGNNDISLKRHGTLDAIIEEPLPYSLTATKNSTDKFTNTIGNIINSKPNLSLSSSLSLSTTHIEPSKFTIASDENKPPHQKTDNSSILQLEEQANEALKQLKEIVALDQDTSACLTPTSTKSFRDQNFEMPDFKSPNQVVRSIHRLLLGPLEIDNNNKDVSSIQKNNGNSENRILSAISRNTSNSIRNSQYSSTKSFLSREIKSNNIDLEAEKFFLSRTTINPSNTNNNVNNNNNVNGLSTFSSPYSKRTSDQAARDGQGKSMLMSRGMITKLSTPKSVVSSTEKKQIPKPRTTSTFASRLAAKRNDRLNGLKFLETTSQDRRTMK